MKLAASEYWEEFLRLNPAIAPETPYQAWYFGNSPEMALELAELVISGKKTATASLAAVNEVKPDEAPVPDGYSVVTDFDGNPKCVIQTVEIRHMPYLDVDADFAAAEGEGDRSLDYWRKVHWEYYSREAAELKIDFDEHSIVCCERFKLLFPL